MQLLERQDSLIWSAGLILSSMKLLISPFVFLVLGLASAQAQQGLEIHYQSVANFLKLLGEIRGEVVFAKLSGHQFPARPFFNLQKISFHPTENLELGFTRASLWAGVGHPFTLRSLPMSVSPSLAVRSRR